MTLGAGAALARLAAVPALRAGAAPLLGVLVCPPYVALAKGFAGDGASPPTPVTALPMKPRGARPHERLSAAAGLWQALGPAPASSPVTPLKVNVAAIARAADAHGAGGVVFSYTARALASSAFDRHRLQSTEAAAAVAAAASAPNAAWRATVEAAADEAWRELSGVPAVAWLEWSPPDGFDRAAEDLREAGDIGGLWAQRRSGEAAAVLVHDALECLQANEVAKVW